MPKGEEKKSTKLDFLTIWIRIIIATTTIMVHVLFHCIKFELLNEEGIGHITSATATATTTNNKQEKKTFWIGNDSCYIN